MKNLNPIILAVLFGAFGLLNGADAQELTLQDSELLSDYPLLAHAPHYREHDHSHSHGHSRSSHQEHGHDAHDHDAHDRDAHDRDAHDHDAHDHDAHDHDAHARPTVSGTRRCRSCSSDILSWCEVYGYSGTQGGTELGTAKVDGCGVAVGLDRPIFSRAVVGVGYNFSDNALIYEHPHDEIAIEIHELFLYGFLHLTDRLHLGTMVGNRWGHISDPGDNFKTNLFSIDVGLGYTLFERKRFTFTSEFCFGYDMYNSYGAFDSPHHHGHGHTESGHAHDHAHYEIDFQAAYRYSERLKLMLTTGYQYLHNAEGSLKGYKGRCLGYGDHDLVLGVYNQFICDLQARLKLTKRLAIGGEYNYRAGTGSYHSHGGKGYLTLTF